MEEMLGDRCRKNRLVLSSHCHSNVFDLILLDGFSVRRIRCWLSVKWKMRNFPQPGRTWEKLAMGFRQWWKKCGEMWNRGEMWKRNVLVVTNLVFFYGCLKLNHQCLVLKNQCGFDTCASWKKYNGGGFSVRGVLNGGWFFWTMVLTWHFG